MRTVLTRAANLNISRGGQHILRDVSLTIAGGDFTTIIGPNGAGKTTLLKCLLGLMTPDSGTVERQPDLRYGYVPQHSRAATVPLSLRRFLTLNKRAAPDEMMELTELTGIRDCLDTPFSALSGGQRQRAMLTRALMKKPSLLALDEPMQQLDIGGEIAFYSLLEDICNRRDITVIMVSHDLHFVMRRSRQVVCLYHHICCSGAPQEVSRNQAFTSLFGDTATDLLAVYPHHHDHTHHDTAAPVDESAKPAN